MHTTTFLDLQEPRLLIVICKHMQSYIIYFVCAYIHTHSLHKATTTNHLLFRKF